MEPAALGIEIVEEDDGRLIAATKAFPGVIAYGGTREEAVEKVLAFLPPRFAPRDVDRSESTGVVFLLTESDDLGPRMLDCMARRAFAQGSVTT
jgi:hypothetical protein